MLSRTNTRPSEIGYRLSQSTTYTREVTVAVIREIFLDPCTWAVLTRRAETATAHPRRLLSRREATSDIQALGSEVLNTVAQIMTDIVNKQPETKVKDSWLIFWSSHSRLIAKINGGGHK